MWFTRVFCLNTSNGTQEKTPNTGTNAGIYAEPYAIPFYNETC